MEDILIWFFCQRNSCMRLSQNLVNKFGVQVQLQAMYINSGLLPLNNQNSPNLQKVSGYNAMVKPND